MRAESVSESIYQICNASAKIRARCYFAHVAVDLSRDRQSLEEVNDPHTLHALVLGNQHSRARRPPLKCLADRPHVDGGHLPASPHVGGELENVGGISL